MDYLEKINDLYKQEHRLNIELGDIDKKMRRLLARKEKVKRLISRNMRYRNSVVELRNTELKNKVNL